MADSAFIILPTYNEAENIGRIIKKIREETNDLGWTISIVVVDSCSPDGTAEQVKKIRKQDKTTYLLQSPKKGLGKAYLEGIKWILKKHPRTNCVFQMDADFSHDPKHIKRFLSRINSGTDFVIGSRYVSGGRTLNWQKRRLLLSSLGNLYIKYIGGMKGISDYTSGFRCISMSFLSTIDFNKSFPSGFAFQIALLKKAISRGGRVKEVPIIFHQRNKGKSKLKIKDFFECLKVATILRFYND